MTNLWDIPAEEYHPFYDTYISKVNGTDVPKLLETTPDELALWYNDYPAEKLESGYAPGKWSPKEVLGHIIDAERVFAYRAFRISRGDSTPLAGFDQDPYVPAGRFHELSLKELLEEYMLVRRSSLMMIRRLNPDQLLLTGNASGADISLRAQVAVMAGHEQHHLTILRQRYL